MPYHEVLPPADLDSAATAIALKVCTGATPLDVGCRHLAELLHKTSIPEEVSGQVFKRFPPVRGQQTVVDLAGRLRSLMIAKILPSVVDGTTKADFVMLAQGRSFSGWVRSFMARASLSELRNLGYEYRHSPLAFDDAWTSAADRTNGSVSSPEQTVFARDFTEETERVTDCLQGSHPNDLVRFRARALQRAYRLPAPTRVARTEQREAILSILDEDPRSAAKVVSSMARGVFVASPLALPFADWALDELSSLAETDPRVAAMLARSAASAVLPLPAKVLSELRQRFVTCCDPASREATRLAASTFRSWRDASSTVAGNTIKSMTTKSDETVAEQAQAFVADAQALLAHKDVHCPWTSVEALRTWLDDEADKVVWDQSRVKQDARAARMRNHA